MPSAQRGPIGGVLQNLRYLWVGIAGGADLADHTQALTSCQILQFDFLIRLFILSLIAESGEGAA